MIFGTLSASSSSFPKLSHMSENLFIFDICDLSKKDKISLLKNLIAKTNSAIPSSFKIAKSINDLKMVNAPSGMTVLHRAMDIHENNFSVCYTTNRKIESTMIAKNSMLNKIYNDDYLLYNNQIMISIDDCYFSVISKSYKLTEIIKEYFKELNYCYSSKNSYGISIWRNTYENSRIEYFDVEGISLELVQEIPEYLIRMINRFRVSHYNLTTPHIRSLPGGYKIRVELPESYELSAIVKFVNQLEINDSLSVIYHHSIAEKCDTNKLLMTVSENSYAAEKLQSFLLELDSFSSWIIDNYSEVMEDGSIFIAKDIIFSYYDEGIDFVLYDEGKAERFTNYLVENNFVYDFKFNMYMPLNNR